MSAPPVKFRILQMCCICDREGPTVKHIIPLAKKAPPNTAICWGCHICNLPTDGAISIVCEECIKAHVGGQLPIKWALVGPDKQPRRMDVKELKERFDHNMVKHFNQKPADIFDPVLLRHKQN